MWENLVNLQPQTGASGSGISREEFIANVAKDIQVSDLLFDSIIQIFLYVCRTRYQLRLTWIKFKEV